MSEKVGSVYIEASIDTTGVITAGKAIATTSDKIERDLKGVGTAAVASSTQLTKTASAVGEASRSMRGMGGIASNLGFQLQDVAVQAQMGTSAFVILGQQGSQLAGAFGPGGAVFGAVLAIASAIGGVLYASTQKAKSGMIELSEESQKRLDEIKKKLNETDEASKAAFTQAEIGRTNTEFEKLSETIASLTIRQKEYAKQIQESSNPEIRKNYQNIYSGVTDQIEKAKRAQIELGQLQERITAEVLQSKDGWDGITEQQDAASKSAENLATQIQAATIRITDGELAARRFAAAQILSLQAGEQLPVELDKSIVKLYELEQAQLRDTEAAKERVKQAKELEQTLERIQRGEAAAEEQFARERADEDKLKADEERKVTTEFASVQSGIQSDLESPSQQADRELSERLAVIRQYAEQEGKTKDEIRALELQAEAAHQKQITEIRRSEEATRAQTMQTTLSAFGDMFGNLADIAKEGGKDTFKQYKLLASAQAAISAALAVTNVLANPLIPYPLNVGLAASVGALAAVQIAKIQGQQYSAGGGRLYGGPVQAGGMYPVTEDGRPEILQQGNKQYLLPGNSGGQVISNRDMQEGGGNGLNVYVTSNVNVSQIDSSNSQQWIAQYADSISKAVDATARRYGKGVR